MSKTPFHKLKTAAGQRVRIAKDALYQLKLKKLVSTPGTYLDFDSDMKSNWNYEMPETVKEVLKDPAARCEVCALGSLMVGLGSQNGDIVDEHHGFEKLRNYFDINQMRLIEACYEGRWVDGLTNDDVFDEEDGGDEIAHGKTGKLEPVSKFYNKYPDETKRLKVILENIMKNRGTFVPPKWMGEVY